MPRGGWRNGGRPEAEATKQIRAYEADIPRLEDLRGVKARKNGNTVKENTADVIRRALDVLEAQKKNPAD